MQRYLQVFGLHPLVGFGIVAVDWMLFGAEAGTAGISWLVSVAVAAGLTVPCVLIQKFGFKETWGLALGKGLIIGVLTAIPTAIPSFVSLAGGGMGTARLLLPAARSQPDG